MRDDNDERNKATIEVLRCAVEEQHHQVAEALGVPDSTAWDEMVKEINQLQVKYQTAQANYQWMVDRAADQRLDGYRELGARAAAAENEAADVRIWLARMAEAFGYAGDVDPAFTLARILELQKQHMS